MITSNNDSNDYILDWAISHNISDAKTNWGYWDYRSKIRFSAHLLWDYLVADMGYAINCDGCEWSLRTSIEGDS